MDDTFIVFRDPSHVEKFRQYLNDKHDNIKFTADLEKDNKLNFLDITVEKCNTGFTTSVYRKRTFSGLGISFFSFDVLKFKYNAVKSLLFRAFKISSTYTLMHNEFQFLKKYFFNNGYPKELIDNEISNLLNKKFSKKDNIYTVPKLKMYISMPYLGKQSLKMKFEILKYLQDMYPYILLNIVFTNNNKIRNLFKYKENLPAFMRSMVIYNFCCAQCGASYVGSTKLTLNSRIAQHAGKSCRTGNCILHPSFSHIREHSHSICGKDVKSNEFSIIDSCNSEYYLRILESIYIKTRNPDLNDRQSAVPLNII